MNTKNVDFGRRNFAKSAVAGVVVAAGLATTSRAATTNPNENIIFTATDPGYWAGKEGTHVPVVTINGGMINVKTPHTMAESHFIVSHSVVLADGKYLGRKVFTSKDEPVSHHALPAGYKGKVTVTSRCNLHDFWLTTVTV